MFQILICKNLAPSADAGHLRGLARAHKLGDLDSSRAYSAPHATSSHPIFILKHFLILIFACVLCMCRVGAADEATPFAGEEVEEWRVA